MNQRVFGAILASVAVVGVSVSSALGAPAPTGVLYGVATYAPFTNQSLYLINPSTGAATLVGNTGVSNINGISWDANQGRMYAVTTDASVYTINLFTGAATFLSDANTILPEGDVAIAGANLLTIDGGNLVTMSPDTAQFGLVGALGTAANDLSGLAFNATGTLFGLSKNGTLADTIITISTLTGSATTLGPTGFDSPSGVGALAFDPDSGVLCMTDSQRLLVIDQATGAATPIGAHGTIGFSGLAVPAPGAAGLLALALVATSRRRR